MRDEAELDYQSRRDAVSSYLEKVDAVQTELTPGIKSANQAYARFGAASKSAKERYALARANATVRRLRGRLAAIDAPKDARRLHRLLLELASREVAFSAEVLSLARYTPAFQAIVLHAGRAGRRLQQGLRSRPPAAAARAFGSYAAVLETDVRKLEALDAPAAMGPSHRSEVAALTRTAELSRRLRDALARKDNAAASRLVGRLAAVSSFAARKRAADAEARAVRAYNKRLLDLGRLAARIQRERFRLDRDL